MRTFLTALSISILIVFAGCSSRHTIKTEMPEANSTAQVEAENPATECLQLAATGSDIPDWKLAPPTTSYNKKTIFDYINGAAELYFAYDFRAVAAAEYQDGETSVIIDVYDMTTPEGAFGIYSLNRYPEASYVDIGNEGILTGTELNFWKGQYFCKIYSFDMDEKYQKAVVNFGNKLALNIKEAGTSPAIIERLPQNGMVPKTARFFSRKLGLDNIHYVSKENILSLNSDTKGAVAEYEIGENTFQLFVIEYPSLDTAFSAFEAYGNHLGQESKLLSEGNDPRGISKIFGDDDNFTFIGLKNQDLWGIWEADTPEMAESILQDILPFPR